MREHQDRVETADEMIEALRRMAADGPTPTGAESERPWFESLANGLRRARARATKAEHVAALNEIGDGYSMCVAAWEVPA